MAIDSCIVLRGVFVACNRAFAHWFNGRIDALGIETRRAKTACGLGAQHESPAPKGKRPC
jgi:hypothetical protein